ncbi:Glutaredoxin-C4 protein [Vigna angularis]|uniref:Glutaredoxin-C4 protein n=1 Tax=Phaseolus angularis TaxID=3914 RepID=A0A8T0KFF8_PHAAN|nr:Glutaredoxin-C4 protein [Vigna angularis]
MAASYARLTVAALVLIALTPTFPQSSVSASSVGKFVDETINSHKIVIFSKTYCPYCKRAKALFKELKQVPHVVELDERGIVEPGIDQLTFCLFSIYNFTGIEDGSKIQDVLINIVGRRTVPQVFVNGQHLGGSDDTAASYESGHLHKLLGIKSEGHDDL